MTARIDHLVITAGTLAAAAAHGQAAMGCEPGPVGSHAAMGTQNRLWSLGSADYLEALAPDPGAPALNQARWFGLDRGLSARFGAWVLRVEDIDAALVDAPEGIGPALAMGRGRFRWRITVPDSGLLPFDGVFPALIAWDGSMPAPGLEDRGARLVRLTVSHPQAGALGWALSMLTSDDRLVVKRGPPGLSALIHTEAGEVTLT